MTRSSHASPADTAPRTEPHGARAGLRFIGDVVAAGGDEYYQRWTKIEIGELCRETAQHVQVVARVTDRSSRRSSASTTA